MEEKHPTVVETARPKPSADPRDAAGGNGKSGSPLKARKRKAPVIVGAIVIVVLLLAVGVVGIFWIMDSTTYVNTDDASVDGEKVNISAKMLGRIKTLAVSEGDDVQAGQALVLLDDADLRAQEAQAAASLNYAKQNLLLAKVSRDRAEDDFKRAKSLYASGASTKEAFDHSSKAYDTAVAQYNIAQAQIDTSQAQLGVIETQLLNTKITSPVPGTVAKRSFAAGDVVQPGQIIFTVNNLKNIWVTANFEETKIGRIAVGAEVEITVDAYSKIPFHGKVARTGSGVLPPPFQIGEFTKTTQRIPIRIEFTDLPEGVKLLPGMSVEVKVRAK
jgi:membrane fusion protein (multidrug efflux system)